MARAKSLSLRLIAAATLWIGASLIAGGFLLSNLFRQPIEEAFEQRLDFQLQSLISVADIYPDGRVEVRRGLGEPRYRPQYSGLYWQIARAGDGKILSRSRSMWDFELGRIEPSKKPETRRRYEADGPLGQRLRVLERRVSEEGVAGNFLFAVAADLGEVHGAVESFNLTLVWSLGLLGAGLILAVLVQVLYGLRPLRRIRTALAAVRDGRAERLDGDFPREVEPLADELNGLLDHTQEVLARARANVGNLAHALKTPLAVLTNESANPSREANDVLVEQTALMRRQIDHHLARARAVGQAPIIRNRTELLPVMHSIARTLEKIHRDQGIEISVNCAPQLSFLGEQHDLEEMLGNLVDNACKWASHAVHLSGARAPVSGSGGMRLAITVDDDGPGVAEELHSEIFDRGKRSDEDKPGSGLGLSIVRDISSLYGGRIDLDRSPEGGLRATLLLPGILADPEPPVGSI
jgi:signal transduction histidine kinase